MAWTTRIIKIDMDTAEILHDNDITKRNLELKKQVKILNKITPTHNENIIIKQYGPRSQQRLEL